MKDLIGYIEHIGQLQNRHPEHLCHCPRCGQLLIGKLIHNASSSHAKVTVCNECGISEALRDWKACPLPLEEWWIIRLQEKEGPLPAKDLVAHDLTVTDDPHVIEATFECWFEFERKFHIDLSQYPCDTWINLYAHYHVITGELSMFYTVDDNDKMGTFLYYPTDEDRAVVISAMEHAAKKEANCTLADLSAKYMEE